MARVYLQMKPQLTSIADTFTMCLCAPGVASISGFNRALMMNGATAFTSCVSSSSTVDTWGSSSSQEFMSRRSTCCMSWSKWPGGNTAEADDPECRRSAFTSGIWESSAGRVNPTLQRSDAGEGDVDDRIGVVEGVVVAAVVVVGGTFDGMHAKVDEADPGDAP